MITGPLRLPFIVTLAIVVSVTGWTLWGASQAGRKMAPLAGAGATVPAAVVTLAFPPEAFHLNLTQQLGQLVRTDGPRLYLRSVDHALLRDFARAYWVERIEPWDGRP